MVSLDDGKVPVTVLVPCFNCAASIRRAVSSIAGQTRVPSEVILVDDDSSDATWPILKELAGAYPGWITLLRLEHNQGAAAARNAGWAVATQPYIAFLDADDAWHPEKIEIQLTYMENHPDVVLCGHGHRILAAHDNKPEWLLVHGLTVQIHKWTLLLENRFITPSVMLRRNICQRFSSDKRHMEDRLLWLQVVFGGGKIVCLGVDLAATYKRPYGAAGLSSNMWQMTLADVDNYRVLHATGSLSLPGAYLLMVYSVLKFMRRLGILAFWRVWGGR